MFVNTCVKFRDNRIRNKVCRVLTPKKSAKFDSDLIFDRRRSKRELVQEMMFVNTCVKFRDNRLRNAVCRAVTPFEYERTYVRADPHTPCKGIIKCH